jgi:hypothetical protein
MLQNIPNSKSYSCSTHAHHQLGQVCTINGCANPLLCTDCVQNTHNDAHQQYLYTIDQFVDKISEHYERARKHETSSESLGKYQDLQLESQRENDVLNKLKTHIVAEKENVDTLVQKIQNRFNEILNYIRADAHSLLDNQMLMLKANYTYFQTKLNNLSIDKNGDTVRNVLNNASNLREYEALIKNLKNDLEEAKIIETDASLKHHLITDNLKKIHDSLKGQEHSFPKLVINAKIEEGSVELDEFFGMFDQTVLTVLKKAFEISDQIMPIEFNPLPSGLMTSEEQMDKGYESEEETNAS